MSYKNSDCVYPDWEGGVIIGKHRFDKDGYCVICGMQQQDTIDIEPIYKEAKKKYHKTLNKLK